MGIVASFYVERKLTGIPSVDVVRFSCLMGNSDGATVKPLAEN